MKILKIFILIFILLAGCRMSTTLLLSDGFTMLFPMKAFNFGLFSSTNYYSEMTVINDMKTEIPDMVVIQELKLEYSISNIENNNVTVSLAVGTNYTASPGQTIIYAPGTHPYVNDTNQTAFIFTNVVIPALGSVKGTYTATLSNPILIRALLYSRYYAMILQAGVSGLGIQNINLKIDVIATAMILAETEAGDIPLLSGIAQ